MSERRHLPARRSSSLKTRIVLLITVSNMLLAGVLTWTTWRFRELLLDARSHYPQAAVEAATSQVGLYEELETKGTMTRAQAQAAALEHLKRLRFDGSNYVWVNDLHPTMVMHPMNPALDGQDLSAKKDPNGKLLFVEMVKGVSASASHDAHVDYLSGGAEGRPGQVHQPRGRAAERQRAPRGQGVARRRARPPRSRRLARVRAGRPVQRALGR